MKKNLYYLLGFILLFSCQVDEIDQNNETLTAVYSKAKNQGKTHKKEFQYICHKLSIGNDWKFITLYLPPEAIQAHLDHGDQLGECPSNGADNADNVSNENASCNCSGNITRLDLRFNGAQKAVITVTGSRGKKKIFKKEVQPGELFNLYGFDSEGTLGAEIHIYMNSLKSTVIDTSCPEPNILGYTYGDFTIEGGSSLNGGEFCPGVVM